MSPFEPSDRDWPEDFHLENGNYSNICIQCEDTFLGHKRRNICKKCASKNESEWDAMTEEEKSAHIQRMMGELKRMNHNDLWV